MKFIRLFIRDIKSLFRPLPPETYIFDGNKRRYVTEEDMDKHREQVVKYKFKGMVK